MNISTVSLRECITSAEKEKRAIGHFNISNIEMLWGIFNASRSLGVPIVIGVSEGERQFIGVKQVAAVIKSIREEYNYPIFLNADHTYSVEKVKEAVDAGFDMVIYDGAKLSFEDNVKNTRECVEYAKGKGVLIEGELGYIGQSSKVLDAIPEGVDLKLGLTTSEQAGRFVEETGVDLLAPAVGNIHGMMRIGHDPRLDIQRIADIHTSAKVPLVLHGGSGTVDEDFTKAIAAGISMIHISTELRVAFRRGLMLSLQNNPEEVAPYKYEKDAVSAVEKVVSDRLKLFNA
jgi:fructose-bisphosphate aldolase class II